MTKIIVVVFFTEKPGFQSPYTAMDNGMVCAFNGCLN